MNPKDANTKNCKVVKVVFDNGDFSIAYLYIINENKNILGCRWNYNYITNNDLGSPNQGKYPKWLYFSEDLYIPILNSLINIDGTIEPERLAVVNAIQNKELIKPQ